MKNTLQDDINNLRYHWHNLIIVILDSLKKDLKKISNIFYSIRGHFVLKIFTSKHPLIFRIIVKLFDFILDIHDRIKYRGFFKETKRILKHLDQKE